MGTKLSPADEMLYRAVDEVLHYIWDPIGVSAVPQARDEYHGYLPHVFSLLRHGADEGAIAKYLGEVIANSMELSANGQHDAEVARILIDWKEAVDEKFA
jgi:hypothetical protein